MSLGAAKLSCFTLKNRANAIMVNEAMHTSANKHCLVEIRVSTINAENVVKIARTVNQLCDNTDFRALSKMKTW